MLVGRPPEDMFPLHGCLSSCVDGKESEAESLMRVVYHKQRVAPMVGIGLSFYCRFENIYNHVACIAYR